jgi:hypothetical protein
MTKLNKCFIVGCVRNCSKYLDNVFNNINKIIKLFDEYKIIIAYDISDDNSLDILLEKQKNINNFILLINQNELSSERVINITNARNLIFNKIKEELYDDSWNYYINLDFDNICMQPINTDILKKYLIRDEWDSLSFNRNYNDIYSFHENGYYDIWALSYDPYIYSCWHWKNSHYLTYNIIKPDIENKLKKLNKDELFPCFSAFNGFAIYRLEKFINCSYNYSLKENSEYMPEDILENNKKLFDYNISYHNDIDCEHRKFHLEAIKKNNARIRISPLFLFS